jgi:hypothetical protein
MATSNTTGSALHRNVVRVKDLQYASRKLDVIPHDPTKGRYMVTSASHPGHLYEVTLRQDGLEGTCTCPWAQHGGVNCKHVLAALRVHYAAQGTISFWRTNADARRQHRRLVTGDTIYATLRPRRRR